MEESNSRQAESEENVDPYQPLFSEQEKSTNSFVNTDLDMDNDDREDSSIYDSSKLRRNIVGFWFLGLCTNLGYYVMLSAAYDILAEQEGKQNTETHDNKFRCNAESTGLILLADILPSLIIKLFVSFYVQTINYHLRMLIIIATLITSLLTVSLSTSKIISLLGVVLVGISYGLAEITFLSLTTYFKKTTVSAWSSGTGMAGISAALSYAGLTAVGLSSRDTLLLMLIFPVILGIVFWVLMELPPSIAFSKITNRGKCETTLLESRKLLTNAVQEKHEHMSLTMKLKLVVPLLKFMVPLFLIFMIQYTINQGLYELLYYKDIVSWLDQAGQYRWFLVAYQLGMLISRSSGTVFRYRKLWIPVSIQFVIFIVLLIEVYAPFIQYIWITLAICFLEGLCGGSVYVNAFYLTSESVSSKVREFSMGVASVSDSFGVSLAGCICIRIHNNLCKLKLERN